MTYSSSSTSALLTGIAQQLRDIKASLPVGTQNPSGVNIHFGNEGKAYKGHWFSPYLGLPTQGDVITEFPEYSIPAIVNSEIFSKCLLFEPNSNKPSITIPISGQFLYRQWLVKAPDRDYKQSWKVNGKVVIEPLDVSTLLLDNQPGFVEAYVDTGNAQSLTIVPQTQSYEWAKLQPFQLIPVNLAV